MRCGLHDEPAPFCALSPNSTFIVGPSSPELNRWNRVFIYQRWTGIGEFPPKVSPSAYRRHRKGIQGGGGCQMRHSSSSGAGVGSRQRPVWWNKGRIAAFGAAVVAALAGTSVAGVPAASARPVEPVLVPPTGPFPTLPAVLSVAGPLLAHYP